MDDALESCMACILRQSRRVGVGRPINMRTLGFVLAASDHGPLIVSRFDFNHAQGGGTYGVGAQILGRGVYEWDEVLLIREELDRLRLGRGDGIVALDIGANIGVMSIEMAKHMQGWGQVRAFEAQERLFYALCGNIALSNLYNINATFAAVGNDTGSIDIPFPDYNKPGSFGSMELCYRPNIESIGQSVSYNDKDLVDIDLIAIDDMHLSRVDFIKIDVEAMELDVLHGAFGTIKRDRPTILVEWLKVGPEKLEDWFVTNDYEFAKLGMNYLARPKKEKDLFGSTTTYTITDTTRSFNDYRRNTKSHDGEHDSIRRLGRAGRRGQ